MLLAEADWPDETFSLSQLDLQPGDCVELTDLLFTAQGFGPVLVGAIWAQGQSEPLLLVSSLDSLADARFWYKRRFGIESGSRLSFLTRKAEAFTSVIVI